MPADRTKTVTRGEQMLALRKRRMAATHPFLRGGFRPFFFGAATWGLIALILWLCSFAGQFQLPTQFDPVAWHRHEMLFGFVGAAVSGFLLTAIPNWTGRLPIAGKPLLALFGLWAAARLAVFFSSRTGLWPAAILDVGLFVSLAALAAREVIASKKTVYKSIELSKQTVSVAGNNAIVRHAWESESGTGDGKWNVSKIGVLQVWQKEPSGWKLLARQAFKV